MVIDSLVAHHSIPLHKKAGSQYSYGTLAFAITNKAEKRCCL
tara:strand:- start:71 stop:196 length:126 start_codon:yes stop_codon:yes gene_type:complete